MPSLAEDLLFAAEDLLARFRDEGRMIATAESCTGGLISGTLTAIAGSSDVVERGFVTYSNAAKAQMLGVDPALIERLGAVSGPVAEAMASGALARSEADVAVAVTGVAGPGQSESKPAGLVYIAAACRDHPVAVAEHHFDGDRDAVRHATVLEAFKLALSRLPAPSGS